MGLFWADAGEHARQPICAGEPGGDLICTRARLRSPLVQACAAAEKLQDNKTTCFELKDKA